MRNLAAMSALGWITLFMTSTAIDVCASSMMLSPEASAKVEPALLRRLAAESRLVVVVAPRVLLAGSGVSLDVDAELSRFAGSLEATHSVDIHGRSGAGLQIEIDAARFAELAEDPSIGWIAEPIAPIPLAESEALEDMRVPEYWGLGGRGAGVRIGVIDVGFSGLTERLGRELPSAVQTRSFYGGATGNGDLSGGGESHGVACAEVVHDVAPEAELYLANVSSEVDLARALDWMLEQNVEVISHSLAWFSGGGDGGGPVNEVVQRAEEEGVLFVTAAGNFATSHWSGPFRDRDADALLEFDSEDDESIALPSVPSGETVSMILTWDRWPLSSDVGFDVELHDATRGRLATSADDFGDSPFAYRVVEAASPGQNAELSIQVRRSRGTAEGVSLRVFRVDGGGRPLGSHRVPSGSLAIPADSPHVLSVGAFRWRADAGAQELEEFSSYGPTGTGLAKPEILGPDAVENSVYGRFSGTSAACPHVAGAAALLLSTPIRGGLYDVRWSLEDLRRILNRGALPLTDGSPSGAAGAGRVRLLVDTVGFTPALRVVENRGRLTIALDGAMSPAASALGLYDIGGRIVGRLELSRRDPFGAEWSTRPPSSLVRGRYWLLEPTSGARASILWLGR